MNLEAERAQQITEQNKRIDHVLEIIENRIVVFRHRNYSAKVSVKLSRSAFYRLLHGDKNGNHVLVLFPGAHKR